MNISIKKFRKSEKIKWFSILMIFLFLESSFCEIFHSIGTDFEIELAEKQFEDKLEKLEKEFEKEFEKDKYTSGYYNRSKLVAFQNAYTSLLFKTYLSYKEIHLPPPEVSLS